MHLIPVSQELAFWKLLNRGCVNFEHETNASLRQRVEALTWPACILCSFDMCKNLMAIVFIVSNPSLCDFPGDPGDVLPGNRGEFSLGLKFFRWVWPEFETEYSPILCCVVRTLPPALVLQGQNHLSLVIVLCSMNSMWPADHHK